LGTVDASLVAVAERLKIIRLASFNTKDFYTVRPTHTKAFELVPTVR